MTDITALVERLRKWEADLKAYRMVTLGIADEAADALTAQAEEIARLEARADAAHQRQHYAEQERDEAEREIERLRRTYWHGDSTGRDPVTELDTLRRAVADLLHYNPDTWPEHGNAPLAISAALASRLMEVERLTKWVDDLQSGMWVNCVYCGHRYGPGETTPTSMADALKEHIERCPKHPMSACRAEIERLRGGFTQQDVDFLRSFGNAQMDIAEGPMLHDLANRIAARLPEND